MKILPLLVVLGVVTVNVQCFVIEGVAKSSRRNNEAGGFTTTAWRRPVAADSASSSLERGPHSDDNSKEDDYDDLSMETFRRVKEAKLKKNDDFDGYAFRDTLLAKWGACYDVDFNRVDTFGFRSLYLNVLPFRLGRRPFRHETEYDYLCHLQAVVEILQKYDQLDYVLYQIGETNKRPIPGRSPIIAVPLRLDLTKEQVNEILGC